MCIGTDEQDNNSEDEHSGRIHQRVLSTLRTKLIAFITDIELVQTCPECNGDGEITEQRERHLDELTNTQLAFLFDAWIEREKAKWGGDDNSSARTKPSPGRMSSSMPPTSSMPSSTGPPVRGKTRRF